MVDASLVISLKRNEMGRLRLFKSRYTFSIPLFIIEGVDGLTVDKGDCKLPAGTYGCLQSHIKAIQFAKDNKLNRVLILEDDVRFVQDFETHLKEAMEDLPLNWDMLWLGGKDLQKPISYTFKLNRLVSSTGGYGYILRDRVYDFFIDKLSLNNEMCDTHYANHQKDFSSFRTFRPLVLHSHISSVRINADKGIAV